MGRNSVPQNKSDCTQPTKTIHDIQKNYGGKIISVFGLDCASGDTLIDASVKYTMTSMSDPELARCVITCVISFKKFGKISMYS